MRVLVAVVLLGCGASSAAPSDGAPGGASGADAGGVPDTGSGSDAATVNIPAGEHFCLETIAADRVWSVGWETMCAVTAADVPPLSAAQRQTADMRCTQFAGPMIVQSCPPRSDVIAYCKGSQGEGGAGTQTWELVYRSSVLPDTDAISLNYGQPLCPYIYDLTGRQIMRAPCTGTVSARVDGVMKTFDMLTCWYKNDGTRSRYKINADRNANPGTDRLIIMILKNGNSVSFDTTDLVNSGPYYGGADGSGGGFDLAQATVSATSFLDRGAGLVASFSLGQATAPGGVPATVTDGTIDIQIGPRP